MKFFSCQLDTVWKNKPVNYRKVESLLESASIAAGSVVQLPEMFATGFCMDAREIAEGESSETSGFVKRLAERFKCFFIAGLPILEKDGLAYNEAVVITPCGGEIGRYQKIHLFSFAAEQNRYAAGRDVLLFDLNDYRVCPFICYDLRFPEVFRKAASRGAHVFSVIANWPSARQDHWLELLRARAIENQAFVVATNRCGSDPSNAYPGLSVIVNPRGQVLAQANDNECVIGADLDLAALREYRRLFPALEDVAGETHIRVIQEGRQPAAA